MILAMIYIDRYGQSKEEFCLNNYNVHRITLTTIMLATKYYDDYYYDNKTFELAGGVNTAHLARFEMEFFESLGFSLHVSED